LSVLLLAPGLWQVVSEEVKFDFGMCYYVLLANGCNQQAVIAKQFLEGEKFNVLERLKEIKETADFEKESESQNCPNRKSAKSEHGVASINRATPKFMSL
jgi:hypothetical protein